MICYRQALHSDFFSISNQITYFCGTVKQAVLSMDMQMCKIYAHNSPPSEKAIDFLLILYHILYNLTILHCQL